MMSYIVVDINTIIINDVAYKAVESLSCNNCDLHYTDGCYAAIIHLGCSPINRADKRCVSWKKSNIKPSTTNKFTSINKKKTYKLNFKP